MQLLKWKRWCAALAALGALAGCGGDDDKDDDTAAPPTVQPGSGANAKVLFIGMDGITYDAYRQGMTDKSPPNPPS